MRDLGGFQLCVASRHYQDGMGILPTDTVNNLSVFVVGSVRHGAGVDDA